MSDLIRYSRITTKIKREIVLLKSTPCKWGKCSFCDYIQDNTFNTKLINQVNQRLLAQLTGEFGALEIINSGNIFELPQESLAMIKEVIAQRGIKLLFFESHWIYRKKINQMRDYFAIPCIVKTGLETFDADFREGVLNKGFYCKDLKELKKYFDSVCLLVCIQGQTREMIKQDISLALEHFDHFTVNLFVDNSTSIKRDSELVEWFQKEYSWLNQEPKCDILWNNTDFGVG